MLDSPTRREQKAPITITSQVGTPLIRWEPDGSTTEEMNAWHWLESASDNDLRVNPTLLASSKNPINPPRHSKVVLGLTQWIAWHEKRGDQHFQGFSEVALGLLPDDDLLAHESFVHTVLNNYPGRMVGIYFPVFRDGRGYSLVAQLRRRFSWTGEVIAFGDVLVDQVALMARVGFSGAVLRHDQNPREAIAGLSSFSVRMQDDWQHRRSSLNRENAKPADLVKTIHPTTQAKALWRIPTPLWDSDHAQRYHHLLVRLATILSRHPSVVLTHSLSVEDTVIAHSLIGLKERFPHADIRLVTLDTGRLPEASNRAIVDLEARFSMAVKRLKPDDEDVNTFITEHGLNGFYESEVAKKACCHARKIKPLLAFFTTLNDIQAAWITGQRQSQSSTRATLATEETVAGGRHKYNPLAEWSETEVWAVVHHFSLPYHPLYTKGYPSMGCDPCTKAVAEGEDSRSGRWWWLANQQKECGLHTPAMTAHSV